MPSKSPTGSDKAKSPKPDLAEYEEENIPLEDVLRQILKAKPAVKPNEAAKKSPGQGSTNDK